MFAEVSGGEIPGGGGVGRRRGTHVPSPPPEVPRLTPLALKTGTVKRYDAAEERYLVEFGGADSHWVPRSCFNVALESGSIDRLPTPPPDLEMVRPCNLSGQGRWHWQIGHRRDVF